jgi:hypothetical protein
VSPSDLINFGEYFIIESITQGTFREWDHDENKPRFSREGSRSDPEKTMRFATVEEAKKMLYRFSDSAKKNCTIRDARYSFEEFGKSEHKWLVRGSFYEPGEFADKDGYVRFFDVMYAASEDEAKQQAAEDYGDYNEIVVVKQNPSKQEEEAWIKRNK